MDIVLSNLGYIAKNYQATMTGEDLEGAIRGGGFKWYSLELELR